MRDNARRAILALALVAATVYGTRAARVEARSGRAIACIYDHTSLRTAPHSCRPRARAYPASVKGAVRRSIYDAALTFGMPFNVLLVVARCESSLNPHARNANHYGLFQFLPATFRRGAARLRRETGITAHNVWNPLDAAYVAGYYFVTGGSSNWSCA